jgi:hypothetical protein
VIGEDERMQGQPVLYRHSVEFFSEILMCTYINSWLLTVFVTPDTQSARMFGT